MNPVAARLKDGAVELQGTDLPEIATMLRLGATEIERLHRLVEARESFVAKVRRLAFTARTSGGTAGPDASLIEACEDVERALLRGAIADVEPVEPVAARAGDVVLLRASAGLPQVQFAGLRKYLDDQQRLTGVQFVLLPESVDVAKPEIAKHPERSAQVGEIPAPAYIESEAHFSGFKVTLGYTLKENANKAHEVLARQFAG